MKNLGKALLVIGSVVLVLTLVLFNFNVILDYLLIILALFVGWFFCIFGSALLGLRVFIWTLISMGLYAYIMTGSMLRIANDNVWSNVIGFYGLIVVPAHFATGLILSLIAYFSKFKTPRI